MTPIPNYRSIGALHEADIERFLTTKLGDGYCGIRVEHGVIVIKVLPQWESKVRGVLDAGNYVYETVSATRLTGVSSIALIGVRPQTRLDGGSRDRRLTRLQARSA